MSVIESLMEEFRIVEMRGDAIYKTQRTGRKVWRADSDPQVEGFTYSALSTHEVENMKFSDYMRTRKA